MEKPKLAPVKPLLSPRARGPVSGVHCKKNSAISTRGTGFQNNAPKPSTIIASDAAKPSSTLRTFSRGIEGVLKGDVRFFDYPVGPSNCIGLISKLLESPWVLD
uniref:Uncharacterized protein n=1 Tax=Salix viminalis TaxID=40686 RepID=A0A6N2KHD5_SALVM